MQTRKSSSPRPRGLSRQRGFALIISLTLAAFLIVLLLSLTFTIRMGALVSGSGAAEVQARQNALVGLNTAIGQLEKFAGPDQRITAPAEFADGSALANGLNIPLPGGGRNFYAQTVTSSYIATPGTNAPVPTNGTIVGLPLTLSPGLRFVTGVWGNTDPANMSYVRSPTPQLLNWLISGNEGVQFTASTFSGGQILTSSVSSIPITPASPVSGVTTSSTALTTMSVANTQAVMLVGPGTASWSPVSTLPGLPDAFMVAPLVPISISSTLVPGMGSGSGTKLAGRYAYVVLDEGVKAKVNLQDPFDGLNTLNGTTSSNIGARVRMQVAQRNGIELVPGFSDTFSSGSISYPVNTSTISTSTLTSANLRNVISLQMLRFVDPTATLSTTDTIIKRNFHNLTAYSYGVLSDTLRGGLKLDLTSLLDDGPNSTRYTPGSGYAPNPFFTQRLKNISILPSSDMANLLQNGADRYTWIDPARKDPALSVLAGQISPLNSVLGAQPIAMPTYDELKSWYDISKQLTTDPSSSVTAQIGTASTSSTSAPPGLILTHIAPLLTQARMYVGIQPGTPTASTSTISGLQTWTMTYTYNIYLAFAVANPYTASLSIPNGLEFVWMNPNYGVYTTTGSSANPPVGAWNPGSSTSVTFSLNSSAQTTSGSQAQNFGIPIVLTGGFNNGTTVSNSFTSKASWINGYNPLPTMLPASTTYSALSGFVYQTDKNLVIPAGGIVGFSIDRANPTQTLQSTQKGNISIHLVTSTTLSANTLTSSSLSIASSGPIPTTLSISGILKGAQTASVAAGLSKGGMMSIYIRDTTGVHPVYTAYMNADWADPTGTTATGLTGTISLAGTNTPSWAGGYLINFMPPEQAVTSSLNSNIDNSIGVPVLADDSEGAYRTFADTNLQGQYHVTPWVSTPWQALATVPGYRGKFLDGNTGTKSGLDGMFSDWPPAWGPNIWYTPTSNSTSTTITYQTMLFDLPRRKSILEMPVLSVGFLQHANLTADDQYPFVGHQPGNAVGNSWFNPLISRTMSKQIRPNIYYADNASLTETSSSLMGTAGGTTTGSNYFDMSYLLNTALWDRFYFSGIPQVSLALGGTGKSANPRLKFAAGITPTDAQLDLGDITSATPMAPDALNPALQLPKEYAAGRYLMTDGAFNINSTSIEAWTAVLSGLRRRDGSVYDSTSSISSFTLQTQTSGSTSFPRSLYMDQSSSGFRENTNSYSSYAGYRRLTDAQIVALATCLVQEIRLRGPFPSLASFINRGGITGSSSATTQIVVAGAEHGGNGTTPTIPGYLRNQANNIQVAGPLQMAIDRAGINITSNTAVQHTGSLSLAITARPNYGMNANYQQTSGAIANSTPDADVLPMTTISASVTQAIPPGQGVAMSRDTGIPGWLTQADILQAIGPNLSARSDTFVIRAYGDALDLVNANPSSLKPGDVQARAWCEAVVQRFPDYINPNDPASVHPSDPAELRPNGQSALHVVNQVFGRRFRIVSFRWLTKEEI